MMVYTLQPYVITPLSPGDRYWVKEFLIRYWGSNRIVSRGKIHHAEQLPGFAAYATAGVEKFGAGDLLGLITYHILESQCEIVSIDSLLEGIGIGSQLIQTVEAVAREHRCDRLWLITTNDNTQALRFYQKRNYHLVAIHRGAIEISRQLKPEIPIFGIDDIPIRDEIELEKIL